MRRGKLFASLITKIMRSKVHIKSHPLHPILISFPIAFFTGTFLCHVAGWLMEEADLIKTAYYLNLGGILFAVLAAIPGLIDLLYSVPPKSSAKKRGIKHGLLNTTMLVIFIITFFMRKNEGYSHLQLSLIELAGLIIMMIAGWMGGTLVYRNQIGVDHRYANAGKWKEAYIKKDSGRVKVADAGDLKLNAMKLLHIEKKRIVLARTEDGYVAFDDRCPHRGASLADGSLACGIVQCPWHGSQFSVQSGSLEAGPAERGIATYKVMESGGSIFIEL